MKRLTRIATIALAAAMCFSSLAACGKGGAKDGSATDVQIYMWKSGYGVDFMQKLVNDFNAKQDTYNVTLDYDEDASVIIRTLSLGKSNVYDLYFTALNTNQYNKDFEKLDDLLDSTVEGETKTLREKFYGYLLNGVKNADGTTNFLTYGNGWCGIVYNKDVIDGVKYTLPRTTQELADLTDDLTNDASVKSKGVKAPWIFYNDIGNNGYLSYAAYAWEAQYDGIEYYYDTMLALKDEQGNSPSQTVFKRKDGRYQALKVLEQLLTSTTVHEEYANPNFTDVQTTFLNGEAVFMVNGSWLMNESTGTKNNFGMMKMPVISSIVEKLEDNSMDDGTLAEIVTAIDNGETSSELCSQNDFDRIKEARNLMFNNAAEQYVFIPNYSIAKDGSREFLKYVYSDEGIATFMKVTGLPTSAGLCDETKFDDGNLDEWHKTQMNLAKELTALTNTKTKAKLFIDKGVDQFASVSFIDICNPSEKDRTNADKIWKNMIARIDSEWKDWSK